MDWKFLQKVGGHYFTESLKNEYYFYVNLFSFERTTLHKFTPIQYNDLQDFSELSFRLGLTFSKIIFRKIFQSEKKDANFFV